MKIVLIATTALMLAAPAYAAAAKQDCTELKSTIDASLQKKGVKAYSLDVVETGKEGDAKVVGACEGGAKKVVYKKEKPAAKG